METIILTILGFVLAFWAVNSFVPAPFQIVLNIVLTAGAVIMAVRYLF